MTKVGRKPNPILTIAVDCGSLSQQNKEQLGGIHTVTINLLTELARIDKRNLYLLYSFAPIPQELMRSFGKSMRNVVLPQFLGYKSLWLPLHLWFTKPQIFLALAQAIPPFAPPTLGLVYDLATIKNKTAYSNSRRLQQNTDTLVRRSKHIITTSEASKTDIQKKYQLGYRSVTVSFPGVESIFTAHGTKYVDTIPYFLYVGAMKKTKNVARIIEAFASVNASTGGRCRLVLIGSKKDADPHIGESIKHTGVEKFLSFKGYVSRKDLPKYMRGALAFVSPALSEGFGLPLLEAMSCGCPVITANNSSMPEVVGNAGIMINADDSGMLAKSMQRIFDDPTLRKKLSRHSLTQAKKFTNRRFARDVLLTIYKILRTEKKADESKQL
ncbi:MAG: glycosyltransferase family 1 protein [Patescibacteria group bacterium]